MTKGQRIKIKREKLGIGQTELAEKLKISKQTLYKYENDIVTNIPSDKVEEIASALNCTPGYIMGWDEDYVDMAELLDYKHSTLELTETEYNIVINYRNAESGIKNSVLKLLDVNTEECGYLTRIK